MRCGVAAGMPWLLLSLPLLVLLVDQVLGDSPDELLKEDIYDPLDDVYDNLTESDDDPLLDFGDSLEEYAGYGEYSLFYYSDEYDEYYNTYGMYADEYGYDYFETDSRGETDCTEDGKGKTSTKGPNYICPAWP